MVISTNSTSLLIKYEFQPTVINIIVTIATHPQLSDLHRVGVRVKEHLYVFHRFLAKGAWLSELVGSITSSLLKLLEGRERREIFHF